MNWRRPPPATPASCKKFPRCVPVVRPNREKAAISRKSGVLTLIFSGFYTIIRFDNTCVKGTHNGGKMIKTGSGRGGCRRFTLVELMMVVAIIGAIAVLGIGVFNFTNYKIAETR
ncbi:MAG: type IV pilin protein, partial [Victivallaceae bacterium]